MCQAAAEPQSVTWLVVGTLLQLSGIDKYGRGPDVLAGVDLQIGSGRVDG